MGAFILLGSMILIGHVVTPNLVYSLHPQLSPEDISISKTDPSQTQINIMSEYCYANAERVSLGQNVVPELVKAGVVSSLYSNITCNDISCLLSQAEIVHEKAQKEILQHLPLLKLPTNTKPLSN
jgi:hypothetical protein